MGSTRSKCSATEQSQNDREDEEDEEDGEDTAPEPNCANWVLGWEPTDNRLETCADGIRDQHKRWNNKLNASLLKRQTPLDGSKGTYKRWQTPLDGSKGTYKRWPHPGKETQYWRHERQYSDRFLVDESQYMLMDFSQRKRRRISNPYIYV